MSSSPSSPSSSSRSSSSSSPPSSSPPSPSFSFPSSFSPSPSPPSRAARHRRRRERRALGGARLARGGGGGGGAAAAGQGRRRRYPRRLRGGCAEARRGSSPVWRGALSLSLAASSARPRARHAAPRREGRRGIEYLARASFEGRAGVLAARARRTVLRNFRGWRISITGVSAYQPAR